ncbi:unnamed protein product [Schistosoma spindalis]|nr:unnamed protein product [Schistosoma spindale]
MMKLTLSYVTTVTSQKNSICILESSHDPYVFSGFFLTLIGLVLGLIIMFNTKLHTTSTKNSIFIVITVIILIVGFVLLISRANPYEVTFSAPVATVFALLANFVGVKLHDPGRNWKMILFATGGAFVVTGFIFLVLGLILKVLLWTFIHTIPRQSLIRQCFAS